MRGNDQSRLYTQLQNLTGLLVPKGSVVKVVTGTDNTLALTAANDLDAVGVASQDIPNGQSGVVVTIGVCDVLIDNVAGCSQGDILRVSPSTAGSATAIAPAPSPITMQYREVGVAVVASAGPGLVRSLVRFGLTTPLTPAIEPVQIARMISDAVTIPPVAPTEGDAYVVGLGAVGVWAGLDGNVVEWDGSAWMDIFSGDAPVGSRFLVTSSFPGGSFFGHDNEIATVESAWGPGYTFTFESPIEGQEVYIDSVSYYEDSLWIYDLHPSPHWMQVGAGAWIPSNTVVTETAFGQASSAGVSPKYSRGDHTHGTPSDPVPAHAAVTASVHNFDAAGNAPPQAHNHAATDITSGTLDGDRLPAMSAGKLGGVPATGVPSGKYLKDDGTWAVVSSVSSNNYFPGGWI